MEREMMAAVFEGFSETEMKAVGAQLKQIGIESETAKAVLKGEEAIGCVIRVKLKDESRALQLIDAYLAQGNIKLN